MTKKRSIGTAHLTDVGGLNAKFVGMPEGMYHAPDASTGKRCSDCAFFIVKNDDETQGYCSEYQRWLESRPASLQERKSPKEGPSAGSGQAYAGAVEKVQALPSQGMGLQVHRGAAMKPQTNRIDPRLRRLPARRRKD